MKDRLQKQLAAIEKSRQENRRRLRLRSILAISVSIVVLYSLLLPAFTLEKPVYCGYEEHVHTEDCYEYYLDCPETGEKHGPLTIEELTALTSAGIRLSDIRAEGEAPKEEGGLYHSEDAAAEKAEDTAVSKADKPKKEKDPETGTAKEIASPSDYTEQNDEPVRQPVTSDGSGESLSNVENAGEASYAVVDRNGAVESTEKAVESQDIFMSTDIRYAGIPDDEDPESLEAPVEDMSEDPEDGYVLIDGGEHMSVGSEEADEIPEETTAIIYAEDTDTEIQGSTETEAAVNEDVTIDQKEHIDAETGSTEPVSGDEPESYGAESNPSDSQTEEVTDANEDQNTEDVSANEALSEGVVNPDPKEVPENSAPIPDNEAESIIPTEEQTGTDLSESDTPPAEEDPATAEGTGTPVPAVEEPPAAAAEETAAPAAAAHIHTAACYKKVLICGMEEHTHSLSCYSDPEADVETDALIEDLFPTFEDTKVKDSYEYAAKLAEFQKGYHESVNNYVIMVDEQDNETIQGYTRYGDWAGDAYTPDWNSLFAAFTAQYAGLDLDIEDEASMGITSFGSSDDKAFGDREYLYSPYDWMQALRDASLEEREAPAYLGDAFVGTDVLPQLREIAQAYFEAGNYDALRGVPEDPALKTMLINALSAARRYNENSFRDVEAYIDLIYSDYLIEDEEGNELLSLEYYADGHPAAPAIGELVFLDLVGDDFETDHVGIITAVNLSKNRMTVMIGDLDGRVKEEKFEFDQMEVLGYACLPETEEAIRRNIEVTGELQTEVELEDFGEIELESEADTEETAESEVEIEITYMDEIVTMEGDDYSVTLNVGSDAKIPEWAEVSVEEITEGSPEYQAYYNDALAAGSNENAEISFARFFDITFMIDGEEIEPDAPIAVSISYDDSVEIPEDGVRKAVHFTTDGDIEVLSIAGEEGYADDAYTEEEIFEEEASASDTSLSNENDLSEGAADAAAENAASISQEGSTITQEIRTADFSQDEAFAAAKEHEDEPMLLGGIKKLGKGLRGLLIKDTADLEKEMGLDDTANTAEKAVISAEPAQEPENRTEVSENAAVSDERPDPATSEKSNPEDAPKSRKAQKHNSSAKIQASDRHTFSFVQGSFSVTGTVVYTVDFHWEANGKTYEFSIPGGGYLSISHLVELLGLARPDDSYEDVLPDSATPSDFTIEVTDINSIEVTDATKRFMADVVNVEFSDPELVWIGKADAETTVGQLKSENSLEAEYSAELTEEEIEMINAQTVEAGDWALISLQPFTTEETLTITMKNGDQYVIRVTDASYSTTQVTNLDGKTVALVNLANNNALESTIHRGTGHLNAVGITYNASTNMVTTTDPYVVLTKWTFEKVPGTSDQYYIGSSNGYLNINNGSLSVSPTRQALQVQQKANGTIRIKHPNNNYAVNNDNNRTENGYNAYSSTWDANPGEWFTAFETGPGTGLIVLNPMNENGVVGTVNHTSTSYKNMKIDGRTIDDNNLRYSRMYIPISFGSDGTASITLPSNAQLGNFSVSGADSNSHSITQDPDKYQWVLHGWVNIATGEYYDVSSGQAATATVRQDDLNVFYADWWAADYDYSYSETISTADTSSFASIKVWDYNELFNLTSSTPWSVDHDTNQFIPRTTLESEEWYITQVDGHQGDYFQLVDNTDSANCWQYGTLGNQQGRSGGHQWSNYIGNGSLGILGTQGQIPSTGVLESLFPDPGSITAGSGVRYLGTGNRLFSYNPETKMYSYNSDLNGAVYSQTDGRFYVSSSPKHHRRGGGGGERDTVGFLPLNDPDSTLAYNNGTINYWFGISMDLDFWLPDTPGSSANANKLAGHNMRFDFTGDDDVWVLIDGKLALDIGGIHEAVGGYIDFTTGEIRNAKGNTYQLSDMGIGAGAHTLSFYYLERGGNASNCKITFNIVPRWEEEPVKRGITRVEKRWSDNTPEGERQPLSFSLQENGIPVEGTTVGYSDGTVSDGVWSYMWTGLDPDKDYTVVEAADPRFETTWDIKTDDVKNVWAAANYHKDNAFGSATVLLGNDKASAEGGRMLKDNGSHVEADVDSGFVRSTVSDDIKWTVEGYTTENQHFYLKNPAGKYLSIRNGSIALVDTASMASWFYMSPSGDLNDAHSYNRLTADASTGEISVRPIVNSADETSTNSADRIHIYTFYDNYEKTTVYNYLNTYKTKSISVTKAWSDSQTVNHSNDTITIALYQIARNSANEIVAETEYPITTPNTDQITGSNTITISGLPAAGWNGSEFVTYEYRVTEHTGKAGYIAHPEEDANEPGTWLITNIAPDDKDETTSLNVTKLWKNRAGDDTGPDHENDVITFKLMQKEVDCNFVPVTMRWVNSREGLQVETFYILKGEDFVFTVSKPETHNSHKVTITTDRGPQDKDQWNQKPDGNRLFTIGDINAAVTIEARLGSENDTWGDGTDQWRHSVQASDAIKTSMEDVVNASKNNTVFNDSEAFLYQFRKGQLEDGPFTKSASGWIATIADLPLYKKISVGTYHTFYYTISEISVNGEQVLPNGTTAIGSTEDFTVSIDQENLTITNTEKEKTAATAVKVWSNADGTATPPANTSVIFELYADGEATGKTVILNGKEDVSEDPTDEQELITTAGNSADAYESPAWKALWNNLQKYTYKEDGTTDRAIVYTIRETTGSVPEGYEVDYGTDGDQPKSEAVNGGTITNRQLTSSVEILKVDANGMTTPLEGAKFELRKIDPDSTSTLPSYLDTDHYPVYPDTSGADHKTGTDGKATFSVLTNGYYEIKETETPAGYIISGSSVFYIKVENGTVSLIERWVDGTWVPGTGNDRLVFTAASDGKPASIKVGNVPGAALPSAGGRGSLSIRLLGLLLTGFAVVSLVMRKKEKHAA